MSSNDLGPKGGIAIFESLVNNNSVISLDLSSHEGLYRNRIAESSMKSIIPLLQKNKILTILNLSGNSISNLGVKYIAEGIKGNFTLMSLKIGYNEITGCDEISLYLKEIVTQSKLLEFDISGNPLSNECFEKFIKSLTKTGVTLHKLYCDNIGINTEKIKNIFSATKNCSTIQTLKMGGNNFSKTNEIITAIPEIVGVYSSILHLCLSENKLEDAAGQAIFLGLCQNRFMKTINLSKNNLSVFLPIN